MVAGGRLFVVGLVGFAGRCVAQDCGPLEWETLSFDENLKNCMECLEEPCPSVGECLQVSQGIQAACSQCFDTYASCLVQECTCTSGRDTTDDCKLCSAESCEPALNSCTQAGKIEETEEGGLSADEKLYISLGASGVGLIVVFLMIAKLCVQLRAIRAQKDSLEISEPKKNRSSTWAFDNPSFGRSFGKSSKKKEEKKPEKTEREKRVISVKPDQRVISAAHERYSVEMNAITPPVRVTRFSFSARDDEELDVESGSAVHLLMRVDENWWLARDAITKKEGLIPDNVLKPTVPAPVAIRNRQPSV